jgi:hypothetical protein
MEEKKLTRKKFLFWTAGITSLLTIPSIFLFRSKKQEAKPTTVKMLSQDGQLVEVDVSKISSQGKIKDKDIHSWIKSKPTQF